MEQDRKISFIDYLPESRNVKVEKECAGKVETYCSRNNENVVKKFRFVMHLRIPTFVFLFFLPALSCSRKESSDTGKTSTDLTFESIHPNSGGNFSPYKLRIRGTNLHVFEDPSASGEAEKRHDYRLEMWTGSAKQLGRGFSLEDLSLADPNHLSATVPPGVYPGTYTLVVRRGRRMKFTNLRYIVTDRPENRDAPRLHRITPSTIRSGDPARLSFMGSDLADTIRIALEGPLPERQAPLVRLRRMGYSVGWPLQDIRKRFMHNISNENSARVSASVGRHLPPGRYTVQVSTTTHRGHQLDTDNKVTVLPPEEGIPESLLNYLIYFGVMGTVFLLGMIMAWRQGDVGFESKKQRLNLVWMVGGLLFYAVLIGSFQFYFARLF